MPRLIIICCSVMLCSSSKPEIICTDDDKGTSEYLEKFYVAPQRAKTESLGQIKQEIEYRIDDKRISEDEVVSNSQLYIECLPYYYPNNAFDRPLPNGWLYPKLYENTEGWKKYFDTGKNEYWVFPNVYCDPDKRILKAMSWMRSGQKGSHRNNKGMHSKFKENHPPLSAPNNDGSDGVYCQWRGWLYPATEEEYKKWFDTEENDEIFTLVNVYCRNNRVTYLHKERSGSFGFSNNAIIGTQYSPFDKGLWYPNNPDNLIRCNWMGWLYKAWSPSDTWEDGRDKNRWSYERYFIIGEEGIEDIDKRNNKGIHGRVINPFCSNDSPKKPNSGKIGVVTAIRTYCFYPSGNKDRKYGGQWAKEKKHMCDDLTTGSGVPE